MCHTCESYTIQETEERLQFLTDNLQDVHEFVELAHADIFACEDVYRESGVQYHKTNFSTRRPRYFNAERLQRLKDTFESDYQVVFARLDGLIPRSQDLRSAVTSCRNSRECLTAQADFCCQQILATFLGFEADWSLEVFHFARVRQDAEKLHSINSELTRDISWSDPFLQTCRYRQQCGIAGMRIPSALEWDPFVAWVAGLPETRRALFQRSMLSIALSMLTHDNSMSWDGMGHGLLP